MADEQEQLTLDDAELFKNAVAPEPETAKEPPADERPRDDQGRFVKTEEVETKEKPAAEPPKTEVKTEPEVTQQTQTEDDKAGQVPSWRLREVREAREAAELRANTETQQRYALEAQLQSMRNELQALKKPAAQPVDFFADPDQALQQRLTPLEQKFAKLESDVRLANSRSMAVIMHGTQSVMEMETAIKDAMAKNHPDIPALAMQMRASDDPANVAMQWYKRNQVMDATKGDLKAYDEAHEAALLKNPEFRAKAMETWRNEAAGSTPGSSKTILNLPPSLNRASGSGVSSPSDQGDMSDSELWKFATAGKGQR